jgi:DNA-binding transcriptional MocR family regulator
MQGASEISELVDRVHSQLARLLHRGYGPGHRLPAQRTLAEMCGVSQTVVRLALKWPRKDGVIRTVRRRASFVTRGGPLIEGVSGPLFASGLRQRPKTPPAPGSPSWRREVPCLSGVAGCRLAAVSPSLLVLEAPENAYALSGRLADTGRDGHRPLEHAPSS